MKTNLTSQSAQKPRIAVAMSGGVDSSVCAALMTEQGFEVVGLTMQLYDHGAATSKSKACCAGQDIHDAKRVAQKLGIPHYVLDYEKRFEQDVIVPFAKSYLKGETPVPCILCNQTVKFRDLIKAARDIGAEALATGHYIRRTDVDGEVAMHRAVDETKDQSYFLFATTQEQLEFLRFPLGEVSKTRTRELAEKYGLDVASKVDSQDICFVPTGSYTDVVKRFADNSSTRGHFIHVDGRCMGEHDGIEKYTVGQRRGLGLGGESSPLYVIQILPDDQTVVVGPKSALAKTEIGVRNLNWLADSATLSDSGTRVGVRVRNTHQPVQGTIRKGKVTGQVLVSFDQALFGVSPGQACVFYDDDRVLGGGWIMADDFTGYVPHNKRRERQPVHIA